METSWRSTADIASTTCGPRTKCRPRIGWKSKPPTTMGTSTEQRPSSRVPSEYRRIGRDGRPYWHYPWHIRTQEGAYEWRLAAERRKAQQQKRDELEAAFIGSKFGRLTVVAPYIRGHRLIGGWWECVCDCGKEHIAQYQKLRNGGVKSCGCSRRKKG